MNTKKIKAWFKSTTLKVKPYFYGLIAILVVFFCLFLGYAAVSGMWNSLGETVQQWVIAAIATYSAVTFIWSCLVPGILLTAILGLVIWANTR